MEKREYLPELRIFVRVKKMKVYDQKQFSILSVDFYLLLTDALEIEKLFYSPSTAIDGFDIYISIYQKDEEILRCLFHGIIAVLWKMREKTPEEAYRLAREAEEKYFGLRTS